MFKLGFKQCYCRDFVYYHATTVMKTQSACHRKSSIIGVNFLLTAPKHFILLKYVHSIMAVLSQFQRWFIACNGEGLVTITYVTSCILVFLYSFYHRRVMHPFIGEVK